MSADWDLALVADASAQALRDERDRLEREQATRGLDAPHELGLHPVLGAGLSRAGFGVHREIRYPAGAHQRKRSAGDRCDLVLTPSPDDALDEPGAAATLFAGRDCPPERALWIEVKTVRQGALVSGVASEDPGYASRLSGPAVKDVAKLAGDPHIACAASLIVLFCAGEDVARHDLGVWAHACLDAGHTIGPPRLRGFDIPDRIGNRWCAVAVTQVS